MVESAPSLLSLAFFIDDFFPSCLQSTRSTRVHKTLFHWDGKRPKHARSSNVKIWRSSSAKQRTMSSKTRKAKLGKRHRFEERPTRHLKNPRRPEECIELPPVSSPLQMSSCLMLTLLLPVPEPSALPTLKFVQARLSNAFSALERSHNEHVVVLENCEKERAELDRQETDVRQQVATASDRFDWFVDFKDWVEDVANFLENKVCSICSP
jgi:hypothetical protein